MERNSQKGASTEPAKRAPEPTKMKMRTHPKERRIVMTSFDILRSRKETQNACIAIICHITELSTFLTRFHAYRRPDGNSYVSSMFQSAWEKRFESCIHLSEEAAYLERCKVALAKQLDPVSIECSSQCRRLGEDQELGQVARASGESGLHCRSQHRSKHSK